jgi:hypothetical protein
MATESMHVTISAGITAVTHQDRNLMQRLRQQGPEVPVALSAAHISARVSFYGVIQVREFQWIVQEEHCLSGQALDMFPSNQS